MKSEKQTSRSSGLYFGELSCCNSQNFKNSSTRDLVFGSDCYDCIWNSLDNELKLSKDVLSFKRKLKSKLLCSAWNFINDVSCILCMIVYSD